MSYIGNLPFGKTLRTVTSTTANGSATVFYPDGGYDVNFVDVYVSGVRLTSGLDYTASDGISINLLFTPTVDSTVDIVAYGLLELVSPVFPGSISVGSNVVLNTSSISVGNSTVNTQIVAGNVTLNGSTLKVGNSSVNTVITGNSVTIGGTLTVTGNVSLTTNSVNSSMLTATGVVANSYGNTTAIPVLTIDAAGRITNATTSSVSGVTGLSFAPANSTITVSTSTTNFDAAITSGNSTIQGLLKVVDSVSNTSSSIAASANSVTTAYLLAANAVSNATAYAATAYSNAVATAASDATTKAGTAYSNAVATAASDATTKAGTAYSNATSYADTKAGTAYSNATAYADTKADTAYSNAVTTAASDATTKAGTAYSNATSYADTKAATAYSNATSYADTKAGTAYSNAVSVAASDATTKAGTAYSNAVSVAASDATTKAGTAYSNAISFANTVAYTAASAAYSNVFNGGTFSGAVTVQANLTANSVRMNGDLQIDGNLTVLGNTVSIYVSTLNVEDNMIYLNSNSTVSHPDLGFAGNYNDGSYKHAGLFRDATDGVWKFFHGYTPEPDASAFIDTSNTSFTLSNLQINYVIGNVTGSANSATYLGGNTATTLRSYSDTMAGTAYSNATAYADTKAGTAYSNATTYAATIAGTAYSNAVSVAASDATTKAGTAYSNATSYAATIAGTAYSNATSYAATIAGTAYSNAIAFAANASNITSGTLSASRLPATYLTAESDTLATVTGRGATTTTTVNIGSGTMGLGQLNVQAGQGAASTFRDIDMHGSWSAGEGHAITASHGTSSTNMVGQQVFQHDSPGSRIRWGRLYHSNDISTYPMQLISNDSSGNARLEMSAGSDMRSPIFYDTNDTGYYIDPNSTSSMWNVNIRGDASSTNTSNQIFFWGSGSSTTSAIGFKASGGNFSNPTGNGDGYNTYLTMDTDGRGWVFRRGTGGTDFTSAYTSGWILNNGVWQANASMRAPVFYDSNDTGYYVDPNTASRFATTIIGGHGGTAYDTASNGRLYIGTNTDNSYSIYTHLENYGGNYTKLTLDWHTGIKIGSYPGYGGIRFYNNAINSSGTRYFSVFEGDNNVRAYSDIRAPIFYDLDNTAYYCNPNSGTNLAYLQIIGGWGGSPYGSGHEQLTIRSSYPSMTHRNTDTGAYWLVHHAYDATINWYGGTGGVDGSSWNRNMYLDMSGNFTARGNVTAYSDIRLKTNVVTIDNALDKVKQLRGVYFNWIESGEHSLGMIAQEVESILPELVLTNKEYEPFTKEVVNVTKSLDYSKVVSVLVEAIKEQQQQIEELKTLVNKLIGS